MGNTKYTEEFSTKLRACMGEGRLLCKEPMAKHVTFRTGGPADWYAYIESVPMLQAVVALCKEHHTDYRI